jgi:CrcB protein
VNVAGSFALGFTLGLLPGAAMAPETRAFLTIGVFGAFTTFSAFSWESIALVQDGEWVRAAIYVGGSVAAGLLAVVAGLGLAGVLE